METSIITFQATCDKWRKYIENHKVIYLHAMFGFGKTVQATVFAQQYFENYRIFDASADRFLHDIELCFNNNQTTREKTLIIIDNMQEVTDTDREEKLLNLLSAALDNKNIHFMLLGTAPLPSFLLPIKLSKKIVIEDKSALQMGIEQIISLMEQYDVFANLKTLELKKYATKCLEFSNGYAVAVLFYLERFGENIYNIKAASRLAESDLKSYFELKTKGLSEQKRELLLRLCVFEKFNVPMAQMAIGANSIPAMTALLTCGCLEQTSSDMFLFEPNFYRYIQGEMLNTDLFNSQELLQMAGELYEAQRNMKAALHCFSLAQNYDKLEEIIIYLSENADGCEFAEICEQYMDELAPEREQGNPRLLGAKAMLEAYSLRKSGYELYLNRLKNLVEQKKDEQVLAVYMRTLIACPIANSDNLKDNLLLFVEYVVKNGVALEFITPTGNMPSLLNGGLDLLSWSTANPLFQTMIKSVAESVIGFEAVGVYHTIMGEIYYERSQISTAMEHLAKGLDEASRDGSIRMQYTATAVMSKLFCFEDNIEKAEEMLEQLYQKATAERFMELLPNIRASMVHLALQKGDLAFCTNWLETAAPNEFLKFYLTKRFLLFTKAKVYTALGRDLDALHIITVLEQYTEIAERKYFKAELNILKAIIYNRRGEPWQEYLVRAMTIAQEYKLVRVIADYGAAVLPLFDEVKWQKQSLPKDYISSVKNELEKSALLYPNHLKLRQKRSNLTQKETQVLYLIAKGYNNEQMAQELGISSRTVKFHISNIMGKFEVKNRASLVATAHDVGLL